MKSEKIIDNKTFSFYGFINLEKAFETVTHKIILQKLHFYGHLGKDISWFISYMSKKSSVSNLALNFHCMQNPNRSRLYTNVSIHLQLHI